MLPHTTHAHTHTYTYTSPSPLELPTREARGRPFPLSGRAIRFHGRKQQQPVDVSVSQSLTWPGTITLDIGTALCRDAYAAHAIALASLATSKRARAARKRAGRASTGLSISCTSSLRSRRVGIAKWNARAGMPSPGSIVVVVVIVAVLEFHRTK